MQVIAIALIGARYPRGNNLSLRSSRSEKPECKIYTSSTAELRQRKTTLMTMIRERKTLI